MVSIVIHLSHILNLPGDHTYCGPHKFIQEYQSALLPAIKTEADAQKQLSIAQQRSAAEFSKMLSSCSTVVVGKYKYHKSKDIKTDS